MIVLIENGSGSENKVGSRFEELRIILDGVNRHERLAVCLDTCHAFAAGYDLRTEEKVEATVKQLDEIIGFEKLKLVHLNDSKGDLNAHIDRHEHIGMGKIGENGFRNILESRLGTLPLIMETPIDSRRNDVGNMEKVKELAVGI